MKMKRKMIECLRGHQGRWQPRICFLIQFRLIQKPLRRNTNITLKIVISNNYLYQFLLKNIYIDVKLKKSIIDGERKGLFLVDKCSKDRMVAIATGPIYSHGDPRMTADKTYHLEVPDMPNKVMDCTNSKIGMGHLMIKNTTSAATKCRVVLSESKTYLIFLANEDFKRQEEMTYEQEFIFILLIQ